MRRSCIPAVFHFDTVREEHDDMCNMAEVQLKGVWTHAQNLDVRCVVTAREHVCTLVHAQDAMRSWVLTLGVNVVARCGH